MSTAPPSALRLSAIGKGAILTAAPPSQTLPLMPKESLPESSAPKTVVLVPTTVVTECQMVSLREHFNQRPFWAFVLVALVAIIICFYIAKDGHTTKDGQEQSYYDSLEMWSWGRNTSILAILMVISLFLFAWASFVAYTMTADPTRKMLILVGFGLGLILSIVTFAFFYHRNCDGEFDRKGISTAFNAAIINFLLSLVMLHLVWDAGIFRYAVLPYVVWTGVVGFLLHDIASKSHHHHA